jgi:hypothetical protein
VKLFPEVEPSGASYTRLQHGRDGHANGSNSLTDVDTYPGSLFPVVDDSPLPETAMRGARRIRPTCREHRANLVEAGNA